MLKRKPFTLVVLHIVQFGRVHGYKSLILVSKLIFDALDEFFNTLVLSLQLLEVGSALERSSGLKELGHKGKDSQIPDLLPPGEDGSMEIDKDN